MIEGLKIKVTSTELQNHCMERASYHTRRADEKAATLPDLKRAMETVKGHASPTNMANMSKTNSSYHLDADDPVRDLERDITDHRNKALVFKFFAEHFFQEDYTLREEDLIRLEIVKRT